MKLKECAARLKGDLPAVFYAMKLPETPWTAKALAALTVAYALSPVDLVPDFIPVLGYLDDLILLPALVLLTLRLIPPQVMEQARRESSELWQNGKPKRWYYAIPIVLLWLFIVYLILRAIFFK